MKIFRRRNRRVIMPAAYGISCHCKDIWAIDEDYDTVNARKFEHEAPGPFSRNCGARVVLVNKTVYA